MNDEVAEALLSPEALFTPALFEVGAQVQSVPDSLLGYLQNTQSPYMGL